MGGTPSSLVAAWSILALTPVAGCFDDYDPPARWEDVTGQAGTNSCTTLGPADFAVDHQKLQVNVTVDMTVGSWAYELVNLSGNVVHSKRFTQSGFDRHTIERPMDGQWSLRMGCDVPSPGIEWKIQVSGLTHGPSSS